MNKILTRAISTKVDVKAVAVATSLTVDFSEMSDSDILELAMNGAVIKWQDGQRKSGAIQAGDVTVTVGELYTRAPRGPADPAKLIAKMDPEAQRAFLLEQMAKLGMV
jgi:hypothetical protein